MQLSTLKYIKKIKDRNRELEIECERLIENQEYTLKMYNRQTRAIEEIFNNLSELTPEKFKAELEKHKDGDIGKIIMESGFIVKNM